MDVHFGNPLGCPHHIGRVYCLVGTHHHKFAHVERQGEISHYLGSEYINHDGFVRIFFHQGYVLIGSGMVYDFRFIGGKDFLHPEAILNAGHYKYYPVGIVSQVIAAVNFLLEVEKSRFGLINQNYSCRFVT